ncbi:glycolipid transfer protein domain-containing protein [Baffinella frigidus]|nr:glycolipid transfer protein domain-containing protein [Cryptophyta sp. CCMP2293]
MTRGEVPAKPFLDACVEFLPLIDRLGKVFYPVRSDIEGNIKKLQAIAKTKPNGVTLQALVREEKVADTSKVGVAGDSLLWLKRAMQFMNVFLGTVSRGGEANAAAKDAYSTTLQKYHGFVVKRTFNMGLMAAPGTDAILSRLGGDGADPAETLADLGEWVAAATPLLLAIDAFLAAQGIHHTA